MPPVLLALAPLIPTLVKLAEGIFSHAPSSGSAKHAWVEAAAADALDNLIEKTPDWAHPGEAALEEFLAKEIEAALDRIDP